MKKKQIVAVSIIGVLFFTVAILALTGVLKSFEGELTFLINPNRQSDGFFKFFTDIGEAAFVIGIAAVMLLIPFTRRRVGAPLALTVFSSWILNETIKYIIKRPRPEIRLLEISGYSFPSGHAMNDSALYLGIMLLGLKLCTKTWQKAVLITICSVVPFIIGTSRIYFNLHYPSDVFCGWCLGAIIAIAFSSDIFVPKKRGIMKI